MRLLLIGGWGQLGTDLRARAADHEVIAPRHAELDVTDAAGAHHAIGEARPDAVVNAAAFHKVELCEDDPERAFAVNALGALNVARAAAEVGARTVFISTDYVFGAAGLDAYAEDAPPEPLNVYGMSKVAGEVAVRAADPRSMIVRGSGLFGHAGSAGKGGNFVDNMLARARAGESLSIVNDQVFSPTATHDMADRIIRLLEAEAAPGIYHAANAGRCSWYDLARRAAEIAGIEADIQPRPTGESPVRRPSSSVLLDTRSADAGLPPNRDWDAALAWYLAARPTALAGSSPS